MIAKLRAELESIQRHEWSHALIGATSSTMIDGKPHVHTSRDVCPRCASRRVCRAASLRLAEAEVVVIGGGV